MPMSGPAKRSVRRQGAIAIGPNHTRRGGVRLVLSLALSTLLFVATRAIGAAPQWTMVWSDEFNAAANTPPNPQTWSYDLCQGCGNNELETYTTSTQNCRHDGNGHLVIEADQTGANSWTSARIKSQAMFSHQWGRIESLIQIPYGQGLWPAFWMLGTNIGTVGWPTCGEIDIMENVGSNTTPSTASSRVYGTLHGPNGGGNYGDGGNYTMPGGVALSAGYHTYAIEWSPNQVKFFFDTNNYFTGTPANVPAGATWVFEHPFFIIFNVAVGGNWPGSPNAQTVFPQYMDVDYVRVYKATNSPSNPYGGAAWSIPGTIQTENYDTGGEGNAYNAMTATNPGGQYRTDGVGIEACTDTGGGYDVSYTLAGEWLQYTVNVTQTGTYDVTTRVASNGQGGTFHYVIDGVTIGPELTIPNTGGWQTWQNATATGISLTAGQHLLLLVMDSDGPGGNVGNFNYTNFTLQTASPSPTATLANTATSTIIPSATSTGTPTRTASLTNTIAPPSATSTVTLVPYSSTGTATAIPSTNTPVPPTGTSTVALTATATNAVPPSFTPTNTQTPTPATTNTPISTNTPPPSNTSTPPPTATNTSAPTNSNTPIPTSTNTQAPTNTNTPLPTPTSMRTNTPVAGASATPTPGTGRIFPILNPIPLSSGVQETFTNVPPGTILKIYTMSGELVRTLSNPVNGALVWDLNNSSGARVTAGLYYFVATIPAQPRQLGILIVTL